MAKSGGARMTMDEFQKRFPKQAQQLRDQDARKLAGATSLLPIPARPAAGKPFRLAKPTDVFWPTGKVVTLPSKTEARVAERLIKKAREAGARIYRQVRVPLLSIAPNAKGVPFYLCIDFVIIYDDNREEWIDAKTKTKNREWMRGRAAAEAWLGCTIEECDA
jgi:hypothetical protein